MSHLQNSRRSLFGPFHKFGHTTQTLLPKGHVNLYCMTNFAKIPQKSTDREFSKWLK